MSDENSNHSWRFVHFGLVVTGDLERQAMPQFLRALAQSGHCTFAVIRQTGQRRQRSPARIARDVRSGHLIPDSDANVALEIRRFVSRGDDYFAVWIDDLEDDRRSNAGSEWKRLVEALDRILAKTPQLRARCSAHFLVNMIEAYYFGNIVAVNSVLGTSLTDHAGDCENIRHPKGELKEIARRLGRDRQFDEMSEGLEIIRVLDLDYILSRSQCSKALRTLLAWCNEAVDEPRGERFQLANGVYWDVTVGQLRHRPIDANIGTLGVSEGYQPSH